MNGHTPGPWQLIEPPEDQLSPKYYIEKAVDYHQPDGKHVQGHCLADVFDTDDGEGAANARLMAAAPDMLVALEKLLDQTRYCQYEDWWQEANTLVEVAAGRACQP